MAARCSAETAVRHFIDRFHQLQLRVRSAPVTLRDLKVHFADGSVQDVAIRKHIPAGGESRVIDLAGGERVLQKVVFWYDTPRRRAGRAVVSSTAGSGGSRRGASERPTAGAGPVGGGSSSRTRPPIGSLPPSEARFGSSPRAKASLEPGFLGTIPMAETESAERRWPAVQPSVSSGRRHL